MKTPLAVVRRIQARGAGSLADSGSPATSAGSVAAGSSTELIGLDWAQSRSILRACMLCGTRRSPRSGYEDASRKRAP
jgi:hypothetical protein